MVVEGGCRYRFTGKHIKRGEERQDPFVRDFFVFFFAERKPIFVA